MELKLRRMDVVVFIFAIFIILKKTIMIKEMQLIYVEKEVKI